MATSGMGVGLARHASICGALLWAPMTCPGTALAQPAGAAKTAPSAVAADPPKADGGSSSSVRTYRWVQVIGASLFGVSYLGSLVTAVVFHDDGQDKTEKRHVGYLGYPVAGPFIALGVYEGGAQLFVPIGITQGIGALGLIVGTIGAAAADDESETAGVNVTPVAGPDGAGLQLTWRY